MAVDINIESQVSQTITDGVTTKAPSENAVFDALENKVDKVVGKGLSDENYSLTEKNKLSGIEAGAEVNVNADWNATSGDAEILNKPTIPSVITNHSGLTLDDGTNPHGTTKSDVGLSNVNNTSDADKPISSATQTALNLKANVSDISAVGFSNDYNDLNNKPTIPSVTGLVPYTGATANVDLGTHTLTAKNLVVDHSSGSGVAATITKGGAGEALTVVKTSGSGRAASITGGVTLLQELDLTTPLADAEISSATNWNAKIGGTAVSGQVAFGTGVGTIGSDAGLVWDNTNKRLGVGAGILLRNDGVINWGSSLNGNQRGSLTWDTNRAIITSGTTLSNLDFGIGSPTARIRLSTSFNLLIGTTTDDGFRLDVNGTTRIQGNTSIGGGVAGARLDVLAQGALSTDVAFRVRNSADTANLFDVLGDGTARVQGALTVTADSFVNGVRIGRGGGNLTNNTVFGRNAFTANTTGANNTAFGENSMSGNITGGSNVAFGRNTLQTSTATFGNVAVGFASMATATGSQCVAVGQSALQVASGGENTAVGASALGSNTTGIRNTAVGQAALAANLTGSLNVAIGRNAGLSIADNVTPLTVASNSIFVGAFARPLANNQTNQIVIGDNAVGAGSNTATIGNASITKTILRGTLNASSLPTSATGLVAGDIWNDGGTLKIV